jgi:acyl-CoA reductase-like NAD-dependent aldehyde dehydrogenase
MIEHAKTMKVAEGFQDGAFLGPVQNSMQYEKVQTFFDDVEKQGYKVAFGGKTADSNGYFINPTIIDNPPEDSKIVQEEPFGKWTPAL